jgi:hypothetical protein
MSASVLCFVKKFITLQIEKRGVHIKRLSNGSFACGHYEERSRVRQLPWPPHPLYDFA